MFLLLALNVSVLPYFLYNTFYKLFQKTDVLLIYGDFNRNVCNTVRQYAEWYPDRCHPPYYYSVRIETNLRKHKQFPGNTENDPRNRRSLEDNEDE